MKVSMSPIWLGHPVCNMFIMPNQVDFIPDMADTQYTQDFMLRHPVIFEEIMLNVAHGSLEDLDNCRLVCRTWNEMIMNKIWENPTKKWGTIINRRIHSSWKNLFPSDEKISQAKMLGKHIIKIFLIFQICVVF